MDSIFIYNAHAAAFGGYISKPIPEVIPTQAMVSLPNVGGYGESRTENYRFRELVSFRSAHAVVSGGEGLKDGAYNTLVSTTIEDLNIMDLVFVRRLTCRITTEHARGAQEPAISAVGSDIDGLRIGGCDIPLRSCAGDFSTEKAATFSGLPEAYGQSGNLQKAFMPMNANASAKDFTSLVSRRGYYLASIFCPLKDECAGISMQGNRIHIPHFGSIFLGELRISRYSRNLSMMRVEMGCSFDGRLEFGSGIGNGHEEP